MDKIAIVTGASEGIGKAISIKLASIGYNIILNNRFEEKTLELAEYIRNTYRVNVHISIFDVTKKQEVESAVEGLPEEWRAIDVLVNNAGTVLGYGPIHEGDTDDWDTMIDTNVKGLLYVTRAIAPMMMKRKKGHIVNMASIAGKEPYLNGNVYCGTKAAIDVLSKSMRIDLAPFVKVSSIHPGTVETGISVVRFKGDTERAKKVYEGWTPLKPEDVAESVAFMINTPAHVNVNELVLMATDQPTSYIFHKQLPE
ncbi:MAG: SDR family NAD(P)-dependent oxidoreductase [Bacteroidota bacterium]|nr:SDR family NAD(P)-dependent oxidoreductase [Bacteroidota bacterium]